MRGERFDARFENLRTKVPAAFVPRSAQILYDIRPCPKWQFGTLYLPGVGERAVVPFCFIPESVL